MAKTKPWHQVIRLAGGYPQRELSQKEFAADLYDVMMDRNRSVYHDPKRFFELTYPTTRLRELARDVVLRLAGKSEKAVRQLQLTYGGGKTHALITLVHLVTEPAKLPNSRRSKSLSVISGLRRPRRVWRHWCLTGWTLRRGWTYALRTARCAGSNAVERVGMAAGWRGESEAPRWWQQGARDATGDQRHGGDTGAPAKEKLATLVLLDEVLMWAHTIVSTDKAWIKRLETFFQC